MDKEAHFKQMKVLRDLDYEQVPQRVMLKQLSVNTIVKFSRKYYKSYFTYDVDKTTQIDVTILNMAMRLSDDEFVNYLLKENADISITTKDLGAVIFSAIHMKNFKYVQKLVAAGANVNHPRYFSGLFKMNYTPLEMAVAMNAVAITKFLIKMGAAVNNQHELLPLSLPLLAALRFDNDLMIKLLIEKGANINKLAYNRGQITSPLKTAVTTSYKGGTAIMTLVSYPMIELNPRDEYHRTPLHWAMHYGKLNLLQMLLDAGADINLVDKKNELPIDVKHRRQENNDKCISIIQKHKVKLVVAGFDVSWKNRPEVSKNFEDLTAKCAREIEIMKISSGPVTGFSCYELLTQPLVKIAWKVTQIREEDFKNLKDNFPMYGGMVIIRLKRAEKFKKLLTAAEQFFGAVFPELPIKFLQQLEKYLTPEDFWTIKRLRGG